MTNNKELYAFNSALVNAISLVLKQAKDKTLNDEDPEQTVDTAPQKIISTKLEIFRK